MFGFIKLVSLFAGSMLFLDTLHEIDLASWGFGGHLKDYIEAALKAKDLIVQFVPGLKEGGRNSIAVEAAATIPGVIIVLVRGLVSLLKFIVSIAIVAVAFSFIFTATERYGGFAKVVQQIDQFTLQSAPTLDEGARDRPNAQINQFTWQSTPTPPFLFHSPQSPQIPRPQTPLLGHPFRR